MLPLRENFVTLGLGYDRKNGRPIALRDADRLQHLFIVGATGTGKSSLIEQLVHQDAARGAGFCLIDPHGDLAEAVAARLGPDALVWNAADPANRLGYNPLTRASAELRPLIASGLIEALKKQWIDAWGVRMEHLLRYAILTLLEQPRADLRDIMPLFLDRKFRTEMLEDVTDPQVLAFWQSEYAAMNYKTAGDGVAPIANKLGSFLAHPLVRTAICEPKVPLRFRAIMDRGQHLVVNLAKGRLGGDTANVLGGLILSSLMHAAFSRHGLPPDQRRPFFLYVDEFHAFTTGAFADMLSEVRKYGIGVTMAQQYLDQSDPGVFAAIMGNVGNIMVFRTGALDAPLLRQQLPSVEERDLLNLPNYRAWVQLMAAGAKSKPFTLETLKE